MKWALLVVHAKHNRAVDAEFQQIQWAYISPHIHQLLRLHLRYAKFFEPFYQISKSVCEEAGNNGKDWATRARLVRIGLEGEPGGLVGWRMKFYQV